MGLRTIAANIRKRMFSRELPAFRKLHHLFIGKKGIEIGGPSQVFRKHEYLPVYPLAANVDGCNFSGTTVWEGLIAEGKTYSYQPGKQNGQQFICEGNNLEHIADGSYDFLLSSHSLEHFANPLKAVKEWLRVLKPGGTLLLVLPDKRFTFDRNRPVTTFDHIKWDFENNTTEHDLTHLTEILDLHDYTLTPEIRDREFYHERSLRNFENRCLHHHVFDNSLLKEVFGYFNITFVHEDFAPPFHLIMIGRKQRD
jgi:SAM-dependent methyltransferase